MSRFNALNVVHRFWSARRVRALCVAFYSLGTLVTFGLAELVYDGHADRLPHGLRIVAFAATVIGLAGQEAMRRRERQYVAVQLGPREWVARERRPDDD